MQPVAPGQTYDFVFDVRMPQDASGSQRFGAKMVRDGLQGGSWFGTPGFRDITVDGGGGSGADVAVTQV
ncbi:hypothetical protein [Hyalangium versicolor]|uniref:hypothetical protein n=1 Tax=Hyalangium versicolor TaxID=2861190 RepID=UPI001CCED561|nr:hypothetical protein [Hyalangium versicolor]